MMKINKFTHKHRDRAQRKIVPRHKLLQLKKQVQEVVGVEERTWVALAVRVARAVLEVQHQAVRAERQVPWEVSADQAAAAGQSQMAGQAAAAAELHQDQAAREVWEAQAAAVEHSQQQEAQVARAVWEAQTAAGQRQH
jgi:hypothetical protein